MDTFYYSSCWIVFIIYPVGYFWHLLFWYILSIMFVTLYHSHGWILFWIYPIHFMIYNVGYILSFDCMIIIHTILHINSPLHISLYTFHYIDTGIIHTTIKHFETIFHKLSMLYCSSWHIGPSKSTFHSLNWIRQILQYMFFNTDVGLL